MTAISTTTATTADLPIQAEQTSQSQGYWPGVARRLLRDKTTIVFGVILVLMFVAILFASVLSSYDPFQSDMLHRLMPIGFEHHLLGTDELGRDMLTRILYGGRISWLIGITPVIIALTLGGLLGIIAGFAGGGVNMMIMRITDVFFAFPSVLLAVAISGALGGGIVNIILSLTLVFIPPIIRVAETVTTSVRELDYIEAARASGAGSFTIVRVHVLPNVLGPIFVYATSLISVSMILAAGLSFLGIGTKPPDAEWGLMLNTLRGAIYTQPLLTMLPGFCIFVTSIGFNMVSDGLRTAMDVRA
ncbi:MAG: gsiD [Herbaspirillum sp.]|nr:gsiD [Herbaspirillum sp.]